MFMPFVCRIVIGKDRTFSRFPRKYHMARVGTVSPLRRDRGFESPFLQRRVSCEPYFLSRASLMAAVAIYRRAARFLAV